MVPPLLDSDAQDTRRSAIPQCGASQERCFGSPGPRRTGEADRGRGFIRAGYVGKSIQWPSRIVRLAHGGIGTGYLETPRSLPQLFTDGRRGGEVPPRATSSPLGIGRRVKSPPNGL